MSGVFTGLGWRKRGTPQCGEKTADGRWACERIRGHLGWHCCDNASWAASEPKKGEGKP